MKEKIIAFLLFLGLPLMVGVASCSLIDHSMDRTTAEIQTQDGKRHPLTFKVAQTLRQKAKGLTVYDDIPDDFGVFYSYRKDTRATYSAAGTAFDLDILMIKRNGEIIHVVENVPAFDETPHDAGQKIRAAIELKAGTVKRLGIQKGDRVLYPAHYTDPSSIRNHVQNLLPSSQPKENNGNLTQDTDPAQE